MTTDKTKTSTSVHAHCATVSLMDFQMTMANLSVAEHALREEPYERVPYLAGMLLVAQSQMESLRQEAMECKRVLGIAMEACRTNLTHAHKKDETVLHDAFLQCQKILKWKNYTETSTPVRAQFTLDKT